MKPRFWASTLAAESPARITSPHQTLEARATQTSADIKKQDIDTTFYLADDGKKDTDAVTKSIGKGQCEYFGHTNNPQPVWRTVGKHGVMKPPPLAFQAWPDYLSCGDFADLFKEHCHEHDLPKNACIIDVCFGDA